MLAHTFLYLHMQPPRRHLLQLSDDERSAVRLLSDDFPVADSGWHGSHDWEGVRDPLWQAAFHYSGDHASFQRVVRFRQDRALDDLEYLAFWGSHARWERWCYVVYLGRFPSEAQLQPVPRPPPPSPPAPLPPVPEDAEEFVDVTFLQDFQLRASLGIRQ